MTGSPIFSVNLTNRKNRANLNYMSISLSSCITMILSGALTTVQKKKMYTVLQFRMRIAQIGCEMNFSLSDIKLTQTRAHFKSGLSYVIRNKLQWNPVFLAAREKQIMGLSYREVSNIQGKNNHNV